MQEPLQETTGHDAFPFSLNCSKFLPVAQAKNLDSFFSHIPLIQSLADRSLEACPEQGGAAASSLSPCHPC